MKFNEDGIVIRVQNTGEANRIVTVLTRSRGMIRAFAMGARSTKSSLQSGTSLFAYCSFLFDEKKDVFTIREAEIKNIFFDLRNSIEALTLAQYFCEAASKTVPEDSSGEEFLRLLLNSLHYLCTGQISFMQLKAIFELRLASASGYMPNLVACDTCGEYETDTMYFDTAKGKLFCAECGKLMNLPSIPLPVIKAMRHIVFSDFEKIFSFTISPELLGILSNCTETYLLYCTNERFALLDFYRTLNT